jgi:arylsulfatase A-like enzyme
MLATGSGTRPRAQMSAIWRLDREFLRSEANFRLEEAQCPRSNRATGRELPPSSRSNPSDRQPRDAGVRKATSLQSLKALKLIFLLAAICAGCASGKPPSIVFIVADQWRAQAFGFAGDPNVKTPNLDRFERECVNFTQAVAGMPVCSPTRATLLTGQRPQTHGIFLNDVPLDTGAVTLPKVLKAGGYDTGCIGKWHINGQGRSNFIPRERRQGFDYWKVLECTHDYNNSAYYADGPEKRKWKGYDAIAQTRDAQRYLKGRPKSEKPFLLWLAWGPPHNPYETAPEKYRKMYSPDKIVLRDNVPEAERAAARKDLAGYYAHCTALDDCIGDLLETLRETGLDKETIIVFTSDHGDMIESQGERRKQRPWEESARVPMLFRFPETLGIEPRRVDGTINSEDVMPTLLSFCGKPIPESVEGFDFAGYLRGGEDPSSGATVIRCIAPFGEYARAEGGREYREVRSPRYTYVRDLKGPWLLYDNEKDPLQLKNLVGNPEFAELQSEQDELLKRKLAEQRDEFLPGEEYVAKWGYKLNARGTVPYTN